MVRWGWGWTLGELNSERKIMCDEDIQHLKGTVRLLLERWFVKALVDALRSWTQSAARPLQMGQRVRFAFHMLLGAALR